MGFILNTSFQPTSGFLNLNVSTAPTSYSVNYALVGGGGAGGGNWGGGGGAGQVVQSITTLQSNTLYLVSVGDGAIGTSYNNPALYNLQGKSSSFAGVTAIGGGSGGNGLSGYTNGNNGGSGGGACSGYSLNLTNTTDSYGGTATSGYAGGNSIHPRISGGGGGAGSIGGSGTLTGSGNGGAGIAITITGYSAGTFAGGGGGGAGQAYTAGTGGSGGGGNGAAGLNVSGGNATANTGSGGGGNSGGGGGVGGSGASGIVILSIPTANYSGDAYVNGGVIDNSVWTKTTSGSNTILTFLKSSLYQSGSSANNAFNINSLVVGGGGGGSDDNATGGGSGGYVVSKNILTVSGIVFTINVGIGGSATQWNTNNGNNNVSSESTSGQPSTISFYSTITANGGDSGLTTGSLGGYGGGNVNPPTNDPDPNSGTNPIDGGIGIVSSITAVPTYYAGGGSGYNTDTTSTPDPGAGLIGQGGGGGAHGNSNFAQNGQNGVVILSIPTSKYTGITSGNPVVTTDGAGNTILTYNNSGTYTS